MIPVFHTDLDNTLIYSYKHDIGEDKQCVEVYQGREISFMTRYSYEALQYLNQKMLIVPTTTRTIEQYERIQLGISAEYALTCNGGILLKRGKRVEEWYEESLRLTEDCVQECKRAIDMLEQDENRKLDVRWIERLFVFTKSSQPEKTMNTLNKMLDRSKVDVMSTGVKVYVVPKTLSKGNALIRFRDFLAEERQRMHKKSSQIQLMAAGDSEFDISMLRTADVALAPQSLTDRYQKEIDFAILQNKEVFSDSLLDYMKERII